MHPRVRREADAGNAIVDARLKEEHDAKELLSQIEKLDITSQHFIDELTTLRQAVLEHAEKEEIDEFPYLETGTRRQRTQADDTQRCERLRPSPQPIRIPGSNQPS